MKRQKVVKQRLTVEQEQRQQNRAATTVQAFLRGVMGRFVHKANLPFLIQDLTIRKYCVECEAHVATKRCIQCKDRYCESCYEKVHQKGYRRGHSWEPLVKVSFGEGSGSDISAERPNSPGSRPTTSQWQEVYDDAAKAKYWFNTVSGEATWVNPHS